MQGTQHNQPGLGGGQPGQEQVDVQLPGGGARGPGGADGEDYADGRPAGQWRDSTAVKMVDYEDGSSPAKQGGAGAGAGQGGVGGGGPLRMQEIQLEGFDGARKTHETSDQKPMQPGGHSSYGGPEFQKHACFEPGCITLRRVINLAGAIVALVNAGIDIVYAYRTTYVLEAVFQVTCLFLGIRALAALATGQWYYHQFVRRYRPSMSDAVEGKNMGEDEDDDGEAATTGSGKFAEAKSHGVNLYSAYHVLLYTGFFRLLPSRDFPQELGVGYGLELFLSTLPMLFCQVFTNTGTELLTGLQSAALLLKAISLTILVVEVGLMVWEVALNRRMHKLGMSGFKKIREEERRAQWGKRSVIAAIATMVGFLIIVVAGVGGTDARQCGTRQALEAATCIDCADPYCLACGGGSDLCTECEPGYALAADGRCTPCEEGARTCQQCEYDASAALRCTECHGGFRLASDGTCAACDNLCHVCKENACEECNPGFRMAGDECIACDDTLTHCVSCAEPGRCAECDPGVATVGRNGKCECREDAGWRWDNQLQRCACSEHVNVLDGYKCQSCQELFDGCTACKPTDRASSELEGAEGTYRPLEIGHDASLSNPDIPQQYVVCTDCGSDMLTIRAGHDSRVCAYCDEIVDGCATCYDDYTAGCERCKEGYYSHGDGDREVCSKCTRWGTACSQCSLAAGCLDCGPGYWTIAGACYKSLW